MAYEHYNNPSCLCEKCNGNDFPNSRIEGDESNMLEYVRIEEKDIPCEGKVFYVVSIEDGYILREFYENEGDSNDVAYEWAAANGYVVED
jgi:hypothetical protein